MTLAQWSSLRLGQVIVEGKRDRIACGEPWRNEFVVIGRVEKPTPDGKVEERIVIGHSFASAFLDNGRLYAWAMSYDDVKDWRVMREVASA